MKQSNSTLKAFSERAPRPLNPGQESDNLTVNQLMKLGRLFMSTERYDEAITYFDCAISLDPNTSGHYFYRGVARFYLDQLTEALTDFERALSDRPWNTLDILNYRSCVRLRLGDEAGARSDLQKVLNAQSGIASGLIMSNEEFYKLTAA